VIGGGGVAHGADALLEAAQVDLLPMQLVGVAAVHVVGVDLRPPAVLGGVPGHRHGGSAGQMRASHGRISVWPAVAP